RPSGVLAIEHDGIAVAAVLAKPRSEDSHDAVPVDCQGSNQGYSDSSTLISSIGRDNSINCLARCSRSDYGSIASLSGTSDATYECFMCSDKESLAVGTELLVFGKEILSHIVLSYSILTNSWSRGVEMNTPRCLFGSASFGEKAIIAGGMDSHGCEVLTCGEEYDLEKGTWRLIENMSEAQWCQWCSSLVAVVENELYAAQYAGKLVRNYRRPEAVNGWGIAFQGCERLLVIGGPRVLGGPLQWNMIGSKPSGNFVYNCAVMGC
ncbi:hypothetical protein ZWY2020_022437, partial [Hordeum vulgare]